MAHFVTTQTTVGNAGNFRVFFGAGTRLFVKASKFRAITWFVLE